MMEPNSPDWTRIVEETEHPDHYTQGKYEVLDVIEDWGLVGDFHLANVIKYVARAKYHGSELTDLCKARFYLARAIEARMRNA